MTTNSERKVISVHTCLLQWTVLMALAFLITTLFGPKSLWAVVADGRSLLWQLGAGIAIGLFHEAGIVLIHLLRFVAILIRDVRAGFQLELIELRIIHIFSGDADAPMLDFAVEIVILTVEEADEHDPELP